MRSHLTAYARPEGMVGASIPGPSSRDLSEGTILTSRVLKEEFLKAPWVRCSLADGKILDANYEKTFYLRFKSQLPTFQAGNKNIVELIRKYYDFYRKKKVETLVVGPVLPEVNPETRDLIRDELNHLEAIYLELPPNRAKKALSDINGLKQKYLGGAFLPPTLQKADWTPGEIYHLVLRIKVLHNEAYEIEVDRTFREVLDELTDSGGCLVEEKRQILNLLEKFVACENRAYR
jgi:hypothetical protein